MALRSYGFGYGPDTKRTQADLDHKAAMDKIDQEAASTPPETEEGRAARQRFEDERWTEKCRQAVEGMRR